MRVLAGDTADQLWLNAVAAFKAGEFATDCPSRDGVTSELLHVALTVKDPRQRWVVSRTPAINPAFAIAEVVWMMAGRRDAAFLNYFNPSLPQFAGTGKTYHGAYGFRLRNHFGIDQLDRAYKALRYAPESRQVVLQIWDSAADLPGKNGQPLDPDIPCNLLSMLKVRDGALEWTQIMRSNDLFLGLPHNLVQFTTLQEVLAGWLGLKLGTYNHFSDSLHVYDRDARHVRATEQIPAEDNPDRLDLPRAISETLFAELANRIDSLVRCEFDAAETQRLAAWAGAPPAFRNLLLVVCAEGSRRTKQIPEVHALMCECTNPLLHQLWDRWCHRVGAAMRQVT